MIVERVQHSGAWKITGVLEGESDHHFLTRVYYGYSKSQAIRLWREHVKDEANK